MVIKKMSINRERKIFLVTPPKTLDESLIMGFKWSIPNIGLGYLSSYISQFGYSVKIYDLTYYSLNNFIKELKEENPTIVGITATTEEYYGILRILKIIKKNNSNIITILGGAHVTALPKETLMEFDELDFAIFGEGEISFKLLLDQIFSSKNFSEVKGIAYKSNGKVTINPQREPIKNLDELPFPSWEKFDLSPYHSFSEGLTEHYLELPLITQRGCPFQCVFCQKTMGSIVRKRSLDNIMEEIHRDIDDFNVDRICIVDETFSVDKKKVLDFCRRLRKEGLHKKITWSCFTRVNLIDENLIKEMKLSGCRLISFGVESGNEYILKKIKKGIHLKDARRSVALTKKYGIETHYGIIFGHPFETIDTMKDSLNFVMKNRPDLITFAILVPFPGTEVYNYCKTNYGGLKLIAKNWKDYQKQMGRALELEQIPRKFLDMFQIYAYFRFFFHPKNIMKLFKLVNVKSIPKFAIEKIKNMIGTI